MSNAEITYIESLAKTGKRQRATITVFSIITMVLLLGIIAIVLLKTCPCS